MFLLDFLLNIYIFDTILLFYLKIFSKTFKLLSYTNYIVVIYAYTLMQLKRTDFFIFKNHIELNFDTFQKGFSKLIATLSSGFCQGFIQGAQSTGYSLNILQCRTLLKLLHQS